jgi:hypothetical protein
MTILKIGETLLVNYQAHIFIVILYYAFMQFKINKRLEVQTAICTGRFNVIDLKIKEVEKDIEHDRNKANGKQTVKHVGTGQKDQVAG